MSSIVDGKMPVSLPKSVLTKLRTGEPKRLAIATSMTAEGMVKTRVKV